jgi:NADPH-dependent 2,4-dienoyl-CoA reductase/sulfur reductase-like enzyme
VIAVGRIDLDTAEQLLRRGEADFIAMGRHCWPISNCRTRLRKVLRRTSAGVFIAIPAFTRSLSEAIFVCSVNALVGKESEPAPALPEKKKWVVVVGGGPAGLEAARTAALRGHRVILYEKEDSWEVR